MTGCAHWQEADTPADLEGRRVVERLRAFNDGLQRCKGLGQVALVKGATTQRTRLAWMARMPNKVRLEFLAVSGHPLAALASDGDHIYLRDIAGDRFHKNRYTRASLEPLVGVPVRLPELIDYLMGRVPLVDAERSLLMDNPAQDGYILELRRWWGETVQRIVLGPDGKRVRRVVHFDAEGAPAYWVEPGNWKTIDGFTFPGRLTVEAPTGERIEIRLERFWPNAAIDEGAFRLTP